jgi:hypothetical protein
MENGAATQKIILVHTNQGTMCVYQEVATKMGLHDGQYVSDERAWEILAVNARFGLALCDAEIAKRKQETEPDPDEPRGFGPA